MCASISAAVGRRARENCALDLAPFSATTAVELRQAMTRQYICSAVHAAFFLGKATSGIVCGLASVTKSLYLRRTVCT